MKKKLCAFLLAALSVCLLVALVACGKSKSSDEEESAAVDTITISQQTMTLDLFDRQTLNVTTTGSLTGETVWSVDNPAVVSVENGLVIAKAEGNATITATIADQSVTCAVTVSDSGSRPIMTLDETNVNLLNGGTYQFYPEFTYKGEAIHTCEVLLVSADETVISVNSTTITAVKEGETNVTFKYSCNGMELGEQTVTVNVIEDYNFSVNAEDYTIELVTNAYDTEKYADKFLLSVTLTKRGVVVSDPALEYEISDSSVCQFNPQTNTISALKVGVAELTISYLSGNKTYKTIVTVNVNKEQVKVDQEFIMLSGDELDITSMPMKATDILAIQDVTGQPFAVSYEVLGDGLILNSDITGNRLLQVSTAEKEYEIQVTFATKIISTVDDFKAYMSATASSEATDYVVIINDLDLAGATINCSYWFRGVLDGRGHIISNFYSMTALRSNSEAGLIKNVGFCYNKQPWTDIYPGVLIAGQNNAEMENVYMEVYVERTDYDLAVLGYKLSAVTKMTDCVFYIKPYGEGTGSIYADYMVTGTTTPTHIENAYVICDQELKTKGLGGLIVAKSNQVANLHLNGSFSAKNGTLYYNGTPVLASASAEVQMNAENEISLKKLYNELSDAEIASAKINGQSVTFAQADGKLNFAIGEFIGLVEGRDYLIELVTVDGETYYAEVRVKTKSFERVQLTKELLKTKEEIVFSATEYGIPVGVELVYLKGSAESVGYSRNGDAITLAGVTRQVGEQILVFQTSDTAYELQVVVADAILSTASDFTAWIETAGNTMKNGKYTVLGADIDMNGALVSSPANGWSDGILDGRGHIVYNFQTARLFATQSVGYGAGIKNVGLEFTYVGTVNGIVMDGNYDWANGNGYGMENVWLNITLTRTENPLAIFAKQTRGTLLKDIVVNVNVQNPTAQGALYADCWGTWDDYDVVLENVYVIDASKVFTKHNGMGYQALGLIEKISEIGNIGGDFAVQNGCLYWNSACVLDQTPIVELGEAYVLASTGTLKVTEVQGFTGVATSAAMQGLYSGDCSVVGNVITLPVSSLTCGTEYKLVVKTAEKAYKMTVVIADKLLTTAADFTAYATAPASSTVYTILTTDLDMNGVTLNGPDTTSNMTLDGRGHIVKNFKSTILFMRTCGGGTLKNIGLEYTQEGSTWNGILCSKDLSWFEMSNVWMNITVSKSTNTRAVFGNQIKGLSANNVVINLMLTGTGNGTIYADYMTAPTLNSHASSLTNVYVVCSETLSRKDTSATYGWNKLNVVTSVSDITTIDGGFAVQTNGLYWNGKQVQAI
ncbi:MAG: Ig-like domain-containing protein [Clostridia bacterium]|nr:Ig-like domain-containing protein [Clostridia bacterium]